MSIFDEYAKHYDLFYKEKDYRTEAEYVGRIIKKYARGATRLLDLGCGTGKYCEYFVEQGYSVVGVDRSQAMVTLAEKRFGLLGVSAERARFSVGDIRTYRDSSKYDAVVALFHVMSYQTSNEDLHATFQTAREHLNTGGLLVFDCWYGPGVLTDPPQNPVKTVENEHLVATRRTTPMLLPNLNRVRVHFDVAIRDKATGIISNLVEEHEMRYLFILEVKDMAERTGMEMLAAYRWLTEEEPEVASWYAVIVLGAIT